MQFENTFEVAAPIDEVFATLLDVERVAPCVPGAEVLERTGENAYKVAIRVRVGPMSMQYRGDIEVVESDPAEHRAVMRAHAREARGQGNADATVVMRLGEEDGRTHGTIETEVQLSGRVAAMGRGVIGDVSGAIVTQFAGNLEAMLGETRDQPEAASAEAPPAPAEAPRAPAEAPAAPAEAPPAPAEAAAEPAPAAPPPPRPEPPRAPEPEASLSAVSLGVAVAKGRLRDRRTLAPALGLVVLLAFLFGRRSAR